MTTHPIKHSSGHPLPPTGGAVVNALMRLAADEEQALTLLDDAVRSGINEDILHQAAKVVEVRSIRPSVIAAEKGAI